MSKLIADNGLEYIGRRKNTDSSEFIGYGRFSGINFRIDWVYTDIRNASNVKTDQLVVSFTEHYNAVSVDRFAC